MGFSPDSVILVSIVRLQHIIEFFASLSIRNGRVNTDFVSG